MRPIKFRGKRIDNDEWVYGYLCQNHYKMGIYKLAVQLIDSYKTYDVDPETVGEFTGLQDKNGVDIYEGDILEDLNAYIGFVYYDLQYGGYCVMIDRNDPDDGIQTLSNYDMEEDFYKIIGNIHEEQK